MIWMLPSIITLALFIKGFLFFYSDVHEKKYFFLFLMSTFLLNLCEYFLLVPLEHELTIVKLYYCCAVFTDFYLILTCSDISQSGYWVKNRALVLAPVVFSAVILFSDYIVLDFSILPNGSVTRVAGTYYFVFQAYTFTTLTCSFLFLINQLIKNRNYHLKAQCLTALLAFIPSIILIFTIMTLMQLGYRVNIVGFLSISLCFMLMMFISLTDKYKLFTMMSFIPGSRERAYRLKLKRILKEFNKPISGYPVQIKVILKEFEALIIEHTQDYFITQKEVAHMLDISEGNLSRKKSKAKQTMHVYKDLSL